MCQGEESSFDFNYSNGNSFIILNLWDFDGSYLSVNGNEITANVDIIYDNCGEYEVSLLVGNSNGCIAYDTISHTVACNSFAEILTSDTSGCAPFEFTIEALDEQNTGQYFWTWTPVDDYVQFIYQYSNTTDPNLLVQLLANNGPSNLEYHIILETDIDEDLSNQLIGLECRSRDSIKVILHLMSSVRMKIYHLVILYHQVYLLMTSSTIELCLIGLHQVLRHHIT